MLNIGNYDAPREKVELFLARRPGQGLRGTFLYVSWPAHQ